MILLNTDKPRLASSIGRNNMRVQKPVRVERTYTQKLNAPPHIVFPLLCPVREAEWVAGWNPSFVFTRSGYVEQDCVFITEGGGAEADSVWVVSEWDPNAFRLGLIKVSPDKTVGRVTIVLAPNAENGTDAHVTYMYTAITDSGVSFVRNYTEDFFVDFMKHWEEALNDYLAKTLQGGAGST